LFDATTQRITVSEKHDFLRENVFDVQDDVSHRVVTLLEQRVLSALPKSRHRYSNDPEAYSEFMAGLRESYGNSLKELQSSAQHLMAAIERDPEFALAHAWMAHVCMQIYWNFDSDQRWLAEAEDHCHRALVLDARLPEAQWAKSAILWSPAKNFQHAEAIAALEIVLDARPNFDRAHNRMAAICLHIGRLTEARCAHEKAIRSNPQNRTFNLEFITLCSGDFAQAEERGTAWVQEMPKDRFALWFHPQPALFMGSLDVAEQRLRVALSHYPDEPLIVSLQGMLHASRSQDSLALECVRQALESPNSFGHTHHTYEQIACVYATLGDSEKGLAWLRRSIDSGNPCWPFFKIHPLLQNLRSQPRFQTLMAELEERYTALEIRRL
jgi:tetratricopeptide (TPR) repeat protein